MGVYEKQRTIGSNKAILNWLYLGIAMVFVMVAIGGITRLTDSGLSMVDWRPIMGSLPPMSAEDWNVAFEKYKSSPQFKEHNYHFEILDFKSIFWWEYIHRAFGRLIGVVFFFPFLWFLVTRKISRPLFLRLLLVLFLGGFQGVLGWYMVKSGLSEVPRVSHFRLAAHLLTAFATISYMFWVSLELRYERSAIDAQIIPFKRWTVALFLLTGLQILYGAFVAGKDAGMMHNTWPFMDGYYIHPAALALDSIWESLTFNSSMIQFVHRTLAIIVLFFSLSIYLEGIKKTVQKPLLQTYQWISWMVIAQFGLGLLTLLYRVPLVTAVAHQFGALVLLLLLVRALFMLRVKQVP